jgi:predicted ATPase
MHKNLAQWRAMGTEIKPGFLGLMADICWKKKQAEEGLALADEALVVAGKTGECFYDPELHRLKGELTLQKFQVQSSTLQDKKRAKFQVQGSKSKTLNAQAESEAEACFLKAIEVSQRQQAKSWELRATTSLARLWQQQGKRHEAREGLAAVYNWFTEGFDTKDLQEAKALIEELSHWAIK